MSINLQQAHWGTKALDTISQRLQRELPGLRGFSSGNLKKMRIFYEEWQCLSSGSPMANQLQQLENKIEEGVEIGEKALGFDMLAAEEVISLKVELPNLKLIAVIPYDGQNERWSAREQDRYWDILDKADDAILLSKHYFNGCLLRRNDYMLSHSCGLIAFFDGKPKGGTFYTFRKAKSMGMDIINMYKTQV